jgi:hypothetical protein
MSLISRIGSSPGVRRLVRRPDAPGEIRESPDAEDRDPLWCAGCGREVLFDGLAVTRIELARRAGNLPAPPERSPSSWLS